MYNGVLALRVWGDGLMEVGTGISRILCHRSTSKSYYTNVRSGILCYIIHTYTECALYLGPARELNSGWGTVVVSQTPIEPPLVVEFIVIRSIL